MDGGTCVVGHGVKCDPQESSVSGSSAPPGCGKMHRAADWMGTNKSSRQHVLEEQISDVA